MGMPVAPESEGLFMVGALFRAETVEKSIRVGDRAGEKFSRFAVTLIVDGYPRTLEYPDEASAPEAVRTAERGEVVTVAVYPKVSGQRIYWNGVKAQ